MKSTIFMCMLALTGYAQTIHYPTWEYASEWDHKQILMYFKPGTKMLMTQECTDAVQRELSSGIVQLDNVTHDTLPSFAMSLEFKDTIVRSVTYYFKSSQVGLLTIIPGAENLKAYSTFWKKRWVASFVEQGLSYTLFGDKKTITVVCTKPE